TQPIRTLTSHFDNLIRAADINAHEAASFAQRLAATSFPSGSF
ncbi:transcriptional regulator, partial [Mesorhizobium sp. M00.F.Ca.ET.038.03.1.1]